MPYVKKPGFLLEDVWHRVTTLLLNLYLNKQSVIYLGNILTPLANWTIFHRGPKYHISVQIWNPNGRIDWQTTDISIKHLCCPSSGVQHYSAEDFAPEVHTKFQCT